MPDRHGDGCRVRQGAAVVSGRWPPRTVTVVTPHADGTPIPVRTAVVRAPSDTVARLFLQDGCPFLPRPARTWLPVTTADVSSPAPPPPPPLTPGQRAWRDRVRRQAYAERHRAHWAAKGAR